MALINEIPQPLVALDTFKMLVMQIREKFDKSSAAKLIKDHVEPMVRKFAASKNFTNFSEFSLKVNAVYSEMAMPVELVRQASVVPPSLDGIRPLQRLWVSDDVLLARSRINFLGRGGNEVAFEQACHFILGLIDKIGNVQDKLDALMLLAMKINASGHEELAQKLFARDVRPRAEILIPRIAVDVRESADGEIRAFNSMMNVPIDRFSVEEASKQIGALQGGNDPAKFKAACQQVLTVINQIGDERVKLDTLMLLVSRINECCAANDQSLAGDIFANQVAPQVYELEAKKGATNPEAGSALSQLFDAMESPIAVFASRETTPEFKSPPPAHS